MLSKGQSFEIFSSLLMGSKPIEIQHTKMVKSSSTLMVDPKSMVHEYALNFECVVGLLQEDMVIVIGYADLSVPNTPNQPIHFVRYTHVLMSQRAQINLSCLLKCLWNIHNVANKYRARPFLSLRPIKS